MTNANTTATKEKVSVYEMSEPKKGKSTRTYLYASVEHNQYEQHATGSLIHTQKTLPFFIVYQAINSISNFSLL